MRDQASETLLGRRKGREFFGVLAPAMKTPLESRTSRRRRPFTRRRPGKGRQGLTTSPLELYWLVDDVEGARRDLTARGATCSAVAAKPFGKLFTVREPEGDQRFVLELAASRPSKAV